MSSHKPLTLMTRLALPNSTLSIPVIGFGVYQSHGDTCLRSCKTALENGYRHIDTAQYYANEAEIGTALRHSNIPRSELFITSKILTPRKDPEATYSSIVNSVHKLAGEEGYVDLFLIHSPNCGVEGRKMLWTALEGAKEEGLVRAIGVSNYAPSHLDELRTYARSWPPAVNQIELHPFCQQRSAVKYCEANGIVVEAYCPLVRNQRSTDGTLIAVAEKRDVSVAQVLIRYCLQKGWVPLPKSDTPVRIKENVDVFGFELDGEDMERLDRLDEGSRGAIVEAVEE
ncbi:Aldo/keto reductase [Patellaria atrata CBS 101060]|uniref:Aldo/keto reductase n=1 Tax=Patellaria atrata CBS 101060 TaxID=1346257 RepID=A0A9P4SHW8_9PEZI|nr:Aldo/keto reductase [Patellaria atrata CBS 101060]